MKKKEEMNDITIYYSRSFFAFFSTKRKEMGYRLVKEAQKILFNLA
jgi:hypothetical protein